MITVKCVVLPRICTQLHDFGDGCYAGAVDVNHVSEVTERIVLQEMGLKFTAIGPGLRQIFKLKRILLGM